jgi:hypothetical protein
MSVATESAGMFRRLAAIIAMIALVASLVLLMRRVYLHHQSLGSEEEAPSSEVRLVPSSSRGAMSSVQLT